MHISMHQWKRQHNNNAVDVSKDKEKIENHASNDYVVILFLLLFRLFNVVLVQTWFVPDEYWQSLEVAHRLVFGYGHLTWEWRFGARSYLYPLLFSSLYYILSFFGCSNEPHLLIYTPRLLQATISAFAEWYLYKFVKCYFNKSIAYWTLFNLCSSWFWWYCCTRTLINTMEAAFVCIACYLYPWQAKASSLGKQFCIFVLIAGISTAMRPTSLIIWFPLFIFHSCKNTAIKVKTFLMFCLKLMFVASGIFMVAMAIDRCCYGTWINVHYNFVQFNIFHDQGTFYGTHPWHWYVTQGLLVVIGPHFPFVLYYMLQVLCHKTPYQSSNVTSIQNVLSFIIIFSTIIYSIPGHKEFRFILPLVPLFSVLISLSLSVSSKKFKLLAVVWLLLTNIPIMLYTGLIHQSGPSSIMNYIQQDISSSLPTHKMYSSKGKPSVFFLMPCHSTPYYSSIHSNITMRFLTCEPDLVNQNDDYIDEADLFYVDANLWVTNNFVINNYNETKTTFANTCQDNNPLLIILYDVLYERLKNILSHCYRECYRTFHTHFPEGRVGQFIVILCKI